MFSADDPTTGWQTDRQTPPKTKFTPGKRTKPRVCTWSLTPQLIVCELSGDSLLIAATSGWRRVGGFYLPSSVGLILTLLAPLTTRRSDWSVKCKCDRWCSMPRYFNLPAVAMVVGVVDQKRKCALSPSETPWRLLEGTSNLFKSLYSSAAKSVWLIK